MHVLQQYTLQVYSTWPKSTHTHGKSRDTKPLLIGLLRDRIWGPKNLSENPKIFDPKTENFFDRSNNFLVEVLA